MRFSHETLRLSDSEFKILRDLIRDRIGTYYDNDKREMLAEKLSGRAVEHGFHSFIDYYYLLKYGPGDEKEWLHVLDTLAVQETYFWREIDQVQALVNIIVPQYFAERRDRPLRILSLPCATGEEPLTIAMALNEAGWLGRAPIEILASDGSGTAIEKARQGVYRERAFRNLAPALRDKYFRPSSGGWRVVPELHARVRWSTANLLAREEVAPLLPATVIFCRNVFIYFSPDAISRTVRVFCDGMAKSGVLCVGVAESLLKHTTDFELQELGGAFVYVKR